MSLANSPDCLFRPEDKALHNLFPTASEVNHNYFNDFFNEELYNCASSNEERVKDEDDDSTDLFTLNLSDSTDSCEQGRDVHQSQQSLPQPWRKGAWSLGRSDSPLHVGKTRKTQDAPVANISPAHLVTNGDFARERFFDTTSPSPDRLQLSHCSDYFNQQRLSMETSLSPSPMYSGRLHDDKSGFVDAWQQDFDHFNLGFDDEYIQPLSSNSGAFQTHPDVRFGYSTRSVAPRGRNMEGIRAATMHNMSRIGARQSLNQSSRDLSAIMNSNQGATARNKISQTSGQDNLFAGPPNLEEQAAYRFINEDLQPMSDWNTSESLHSSNSSSNSHVSSSSTENHQQAMYNTAPPHTWWSPPQSVVETQSIHMPKQEHPELHQPKPRRATHHILSPDYTIDNNFPVPYPSADEIGIAIPYQPVSTHHNNVHTTPQRQNKSRSYHTNGLSSYPPLPPPGYAYQDESPFTTPRRRAIARSRSPSPSASPTRRTSRSRVGQQKSPTRRDPSSHRRKSIAKSGPKGAETPRHRSLSRPPRTPKAPRTPGENQGIGFVNFTPKDASKLLNDVAPSGSSKTRARREQEAREKRKKLSEAAIAAVRQAGGDVTALERAILS